MKNKIFVIAVFLLFTLSLPHHPAQENINIKIIQGTLYTTNNDTTEPAEHGILLQIIVSDGQEKIITTKDYDENNELNYGAGFTSINEGETISFLIKYQGTYQEPNILETNGTIIDKKMVTITSKEIYHVNLYFNSTNTTITNSAPNQPKDPYPANNSKNQPKNNDLTWTCSDPDEDELRYDIYFGENNQSMNGPISKTMAVYDPGNLTYNTTYYWKIIAWDSNNQSTEGPLWKFTVSETNMKPNEPSDPIPADGETEIDIELILEWNGGDRDGDMVTYDLYFDNSSPPSLLQTDIQNTQYNISDLSFNTTYYWKIISTDEENNTQNGSIWTFRTITSSENPTANAGGPYSEVINNDITFDGSGSTDDGSIESYFWDFGDGNNGTGVTPTHTYASTNTYTVTLTVTDDEGNLDTDTTRATITSNNKPPSKPIVKGPEHGKKGIEYEFNVSASDSDGDDIKIEVNWGTFGDTTTTGYQSSGSTITLSHSFSSTKIYSLRFTTIDEHGKRSSSTLFEICINIITIDGYGQLYDYDDDGIYEKFKPEGKVNFYDTESNRKDGRIGFDYDGDGGYEFTYNTDSGEVLGYKKDGLYSDATSSQIRLPLPLWLIILIILIIISILLIVLFLFVFKESTVSKKLSFFSFNTKTKSIKSKCTNNNISTFNMPQQKNTNGSGFKRL